MGWDKPKRDVARALFPDVKYPMMALRRAISGEQKLNVDQVKKLAEIADCTVDEILNS